jgi:nucleotide-binding universal stress UspA family protein
MHEKMLACLDGSELSEEILPYALEQAKRFGSKVVLLRTITDVPIYTSPGDPQVVVEELDRIPRAKREAEAYLDSKAKSFRDAGLQVECVVEEGSPEEIIVRHAEENGVNLIALATHGTGGLGRALLGSVADHVLRHSHVPVLCVRPRHGD